MDKITVVVPFGNNERTLARCLDSLLAQTYGNFELVAVSDGSTDGSRALVRKYAARDARVRLLEYPHAGVSAARNHGIEVAKGDYIQFVDADDCVERTMFMRMLTALKQAGADMAVCNFEHPFLAEYIGDGVFDLTKKEERLWYYQHTFATHLPWNKLIRTDCIKEKFIEGLNFCEDGMFCLANMPYLRRVVTLDEKLYHYCVAPPEEKASCINGMARQAAFWDSRDTYWYKRDRLLPVSLAYLNKTRDPEEVQAFAYVRIFDFMLWELLIFAATGADREGLVRDIQNIFEEPDFRQSLRQKERYGLRFLPLEGKARRAAVADFVQLCLEAMDEMTQQKLPYRLFYVFHDLFVHCFAVPIVSEKGLDTVDLTAAEAYALLRSSTPEAAYVNAFLAERQRADV